MENTKDKKTNKAVMYQNFRLLGTICNIGKISDKKVLSFSVAVSGETGNFLWFKAFNKTAESISKNYKSKEKVLIDFCIKGNSYKKENGSLTSRTDLICNGIMHTSRVADPMDPADEASKNVPDFMKTPEGESK